LLGYGCKVIYEKKKQEKYYTINKERNRLPGFWECDQKNKRKQKIGIRYNIKKKLFYNLDFVQK
jgi:hypothetical protein